MLNFVRTKRKNKQDVKLAPANSEQEVSEEPLTDVPENLQERNHLMDWDDDLNESSSEIRSDDRADSRLLRSRDAIKRPRRFDGRFIYDIYQ